MTDHIGQHVGNYRLQRLLGAGGFAEVYLGEHVHLRTLAAIKVLSVRLHSEEIERFREEAEILAHLKHPHIVKVFDFGVEAGVPFLVMDHAAGGSLRQRHPKGIRLAPATILPYVRQVASALQYAHEQRLIHRDVKPENMLLGESDEVLLSDFGIAILSHSSRYQSTQDVGGTLAYMAPEQIQAHPRPASDQYSLGIVIYEWLTGTRPFTGLMGEVLAKHLSTPPPPLREQLPDLALGLEQVVLTALEKDPKERFASIQAFANAFEQACQTDPSFSSPSVRGLLPALPPLFFEPTLAPASPEEDRLPPLPPEPSPLADAPAMLSASEPVAVETDCTAPAAKAPLPAVLPTSELVTAETASTAGAALSPPPAAPKQTSLWTQGFRLVFGLAALAGGVLTAIGISGANASTGLNVTGDQINVLSNVALIAVCLVGLRFATSALMRAGFAFQLLSAIPVIIGGAMLLSYDANPRGWSPFDVTIHLQVASSVLNVVSLFCVSYALVHWQPGDRAWTVVQLVVSFILTAFYWNATKGASNVSMAEDGAIFACYAFPAALLIFRSSCWRRQPVVILILAGANMMLAVDGFFAAIQASPVLSYGLLLAAAWLFTLGFLALVQVERVKKSGKGQMNGWRASG